MFAVIGFWCCLVLSLKICPIRSSREYFERVCEFVFTQISRLGHQKPIFGWAQIVAADYLPNLAVAQMAPQTRPTCERSESAPLNCMHLSCHAYRLHEHRPPRILRPMPQRSQPIARIYGCGPSDTKAVEWWAMYLALLREKTKLSTIVGYTNVPLSQYSLPGSGTMSETE